MLHSLRLQHFRCYETLSWSLPAQGAILCGDNAQGKTSILEAICFALSLHSPRSTRLDRLAQHGQGRFGISLTTSEHTRRVLWKPRQLELQVDREPRRDYGDYLRDAPPLSWLGNRDITLVQGSAEDRRRYLDFLGTQWHPSYRLALLRYKKALKSRNALLKNPRSSAASLQSFTQVLAEQGEHIHSLRELLIARLSPYVRQLHRSISHSEEETQLTLAASATRGNLAARLHDSLADDRRHGFTHVGPHRDDIAIELDGNSAQNYASEGQQRTLACALQLAQAHLLSHETGKAPLLLIDDIFGELDVIRRRALLAAMPEQSQVIITTTQLHWMDEESTAYPIFHVVQGQISENT